MNILNGSLQFHRDLGAHAHPPLFLHTPTSRYICIFFLKVDICIVGIFTDKRELTPEKDPGYLPDLAPITKRTKVAALESGKFLQTIHFSIVSIVLF